MIEADTCDTCAEAFAALTRLEPVRALENAGIERLCQAREVAMGPAGFGGMLIMHALLMPDTPGFAALRTRINELGMGPMLMILARQVMQPRGVASAIATCLDPWFWRSTSRCPSWLTRARLCCKLPGATSTIPRDSLRPGSHPSAR